ncbi:MAG: hypothetical protein ACK5TT_01545 [Lysobacteraceae bacterium]
MARIRRGEQGRERAQQTLRGVRIATGKAHQPGFGHGPGALVARPLEGARTGGVEEHGEGVGQHLVGGRKRARRAAHEGRIARAGRELDPLPAERRRERTAIRQGREHRVAGLGLGLRAEPQRAGAGGPFLVRPARRQKGLQAEALQADVAAVAPCRQHVRPAAARRSAPQPGGPQAAGGGLVAEASQHRVELAGIERVEVALERQHFQPAAQRVVLQSGGGGEIESAAIGRGERGGDGVALRGEGLAAGGWARKNGEDGDGGDDAGETEAHGRQCSGGPAWALRSRGFGSRCSASSPACWPACSASAAASSWWLP